MHYFSSSNRGNGASDSEARPSEKVRSAIKCSGVKRRFAWVVGRIPYRWALRSIATAAFACLFAVPQLSRAGSIPKRGGTLEFASTVEPGNYDCHGNTSFAFLHPITPHYSTLLKFDPANYPQIIGDLAQSWDVSADRQTYTFKLRPNVLFHDGWRLSSADVNASYQRIVHPPAGVTSSRQVDFGSISSIDTPDPLTVVFRLQWPEAAMLANFASPSNCIYSCGEAGRGPAISEDAHPRHRSLCVCRAYQGSELAGQALGQVFPRGQALSRRLQDDFHGRPGCHEGL